MNNNMFQLGNFEGYKVRGRCKVVKDYEHQIENFANRLKKPASGKFMAILDDPALIDEPDGIRMAANQIPSEYAEKEPVELTEKRLSGIESPVYKIPTRGDLTTASIDGAYLEINGNLDMNSRVTIRWDFLIGESSENDFSLNDFALVDIIDADNDAPIDRKVLWQTTDIPLGRFT